MNNEELVRKLKDPAEKGTERKSVSETFKKYVVFNLEGKFFALPAGEVKEISFDNTL